LLDWGNEVNSYRKQNLNLTHNIQLVAKQTKEIQWQQRPTAAAAARICNTAMVCLVLDCPNHFISLGFWML
jgi:hypothetical protein